jgi:hypothetical protein
MILDTSFEVEFVAPEAEITLEGNCMHDSTGTFKVLTLPDDDWSSEPNSFERVDRRAHDRRRAAR